jgi:serine/threonine-protein kinase
MSDEQRRSSLRHAGAVEFMAPEQHDGEMLFQSDIYSFGIVVFELLAGVVPFPLISKSETNRNQVMISHVEKSVPNLMDLRKNKLPADWSEEKRLAEMNVPIWLQDVIARCLEKSPSDRYANGAELHDAICNQVGHHPVVSKEVLSDETNKKLALLQIENERLLAEINGYKQYFKSKVLFFVAALVLVSFLTLAVSSMVSSESTVEATTSDSTAKVKKESSSSLPSKRGDTVKNQAPARKKVIPAKTKDGLINDVPEF